MIHWRNSPVLVTCVSLVYLINSKTGILGYLLRLFDPSTIPLEVIDATQSVYGTLVPSVCGTRRTRYVSGLDSEL